MLWGISKLFFDFLLQSNPVKLFLNLGKQYGVTEFNDLHFARYELLTLNNMQTMSA